MADTTTDRDEGCDCTELCEMGPTCPGGMLARLPGSGCWRTTDTDPPDYSIGGSADKAWFAAQHERVRENRERAEAADTKADTDRDALVDQVRDSLEMWADVVEIKTGKTDNYTRGLIRQLDDLTAEVRRQARAEVAASALAVAEAHDQKARDEGLLELDKESLLTFELRAAVQADNLPDEANTKLGVLLEYGKKLSQPAGVETIAKTIWATQKQEAVKIGLPAELPQEYIWLMQSVMAAMGEMILSVIEGEDSKT